MVRQTTTFPPVYVLALAAAAVLYPVSFLQMNRIFLFWLLIGALVLFFGVFLTRGLSHPTARNSRKWLYALCLLAGICCGALSGIRIQADKNPTTTLADSWRVISLTGKLLSDPLPYGSGLYLVPFQIRSCRCRDRSVFSAKGKCSLILPAELVRSSSPGGLSPTTGTAAIYSSGLIIEMKGSLKPYDGSRGETFSATEAVTGTARWTTPIHRFRAGLRLSLMRVLYDWHEAGGFLLALLSANRDYLEPSLSSQFRLAGLSHVLALSGMHLSLIALVSIRMGKRLGGRRFSIRLSLIAILFFVWFAGASPSLDRALFMSLLLCFARWAGFRPAILPVLAAAFFVQTLIHPGDALTLGFMLSYGALWGILTFGVCLSHILERFFPKFIHAELSASVGAQVMTTPVIALTVGILSPIGIVASCIVSPLSSVFLVAGMALTGIAVLFPPISYHCGLVLDVLYRTITVPVGFFAGFPPLSTSGFNDILKAVILPVLTGFLLIYLSAVFQKRRSPDDSFARL